MLYNVREVLKKNEKERNYKSDGGYMYVALRDEH